MKKQCRTIKNICFSLVLSAFCLFFVSCKHASLVENHWAEDVSQALNDFIQDKGQNSLNHVGDEYVVFDFDNTTAIFDIEEQLLVYQLEHMAFSFSPEQIDEILSSGIPNMSKDLSLYGYEGVIYSDWVEDIHVAYQNLYSDYGPFDCRGISDEDILNTIHEDAYYQEFSTKVSAMYSLLSDAESSEIAYPWVTYLFTGMSEDEVYSLAKSSHAYYKSLESSSETWSSPATISSRVGQVSYSFTNGISVTDEVNGLMHTLNNNDIDVWICSASAIDVVRAAVDVFGLHDAVTGVIGMTNRVVDGKLTNQYDYSDGCAYLTDAYGWEMDDIATETQTQGVGKSIAIENVLAGRYGHGPNAGFMDSTGDFNFCTEFSSTSLVVCFNRANRKVTDGGGLIAETAMYQKETLGYDYWKAKENGDIYYVLQGRDENGMRTLRASNRTIRLGQSEEKLFANEDNETMLSYFKEHHLTTKNILETYSLKTADSDFGFSYGFLKQYQGYRTR